MSSEDDDVVGGRHCCEVVDCDEDYVWIDGRSGDRWSSSVMGSIPLAMEQLV